MQALRPASSSRTVLGHLKRGVIFANTGRTQAATFSTTIRRGRELAEPLNLPKWCVALSSPSVASYTPFRCRSKTRKPVPGMKSDPLHRLDANSHLLKPPINNYCVTNTPQTIMIVGGPNARTDYHINSTPEYFYQYRGSMLLKTVDVAASNDASTSLNSQTKSTPVFRDIPIHEGCMYLLPAGVPHNPVRFVDTVGVVIEQPRAEGEVDRLRWYCQGCGDQVAEKAFVCKDLGTQIKEAVQAFERDTDARTCWSCGTVCDVRPKDVEALRPRPE